jgi:hypothetical protein
MSKRAKRLKPGAYAPADGLYEMVHPDGRPSGVFRSVRQGVVMPPTYLPEMYYKKRRRRPM